MKTCPFRLVLSIFLSIPFVIGADGFAQGGANASGEVVGTLKIQLGKEAKTVDLKYVYAEANKVYDSIEVTLSDKPLPEDPVERWKYEELMSAEGRIHVLKLIVNPGWKLQTSIIYHPVIVSPEFAPGGFMHEATDREYDYETRKEKPAENEFEEIKLSGLSNKAIEGTIRSLVLEDDSFYYSDASFQYQVKFKAPIADEPVVARTLPEGGGEPGRAYMAFYNSVVAGDVEGVKKAVAAEHVKTFEGANAKQRLSRLKALLQPLKTVVGSSYASFISPSGKCAHLFVTEDARFAKNYWTQAKVKATPPAPLTAFALSQVPWPPPKPMPTQINSSKTPASAFVRMISEGGQWKVDWIRIYCEEVNLLWHLDDFQTMDERFEAVMKRDQAEAEEAESEEESRTIENARPLPAGGGDAGRAYLEFCQAERAGNKKLLLKYLTGAQYEIYSQPALTITKGAFIWKESSALDYANIEIVSGVSNGEEAILDVQAMRQGRKTAGKVFMILENGQWKVDEEKWKTDSSEKK